MTYTGNENHDFPLETASQWTANYRNSLAGSDNVIAHYFGKAAIQDIFDQEGCVGMRIYYALDAAGTKQLIIVGVDSSGNDLYTGKLAEKSLPCPSFCSAVNPLNT